MSAEKVWIYGLRLESEKYYVGKTTNLGQRLSAHFRLSGGGGKGAAWTRKYKPQELVFAKPGCDALDEDKFTLQFMQQHGVDNVRGGSYIRVQLEDFQRKALENQLRHVANQCVVCGSVEHFVKDCPLSTVKGPSACVRCGRDSHTADRCYAKTTESGDPLEAWSNSPMDEGREEEGEGREEEDEENQEEESAGGESWACQGCGREFSSLRGVTYHANFYCRASRKRKETIAKPVWRCRYCDKEFDSERAAFRHESQSCQANKRSSAKTKTAKLAAKTNTERSATTQGSKGSKGSYACQRCGRRGHDRSGCYAKRDLGGKYIGHS